MTNGIVKLGKKCRKLVSNDKGQGLVEYALILVLIAVVVIAALSTLGTKTNSVFNSVNSSITSGGK